MTNKYLESLSHRDLRKLRDALILVQNSFKDYKGYKSYNELWQGNWNDVCVARELEAFSASARECDKDRCYLELQPDGE